MGTRSRQRHPQAGFYLASLGSPSDKNTSREQRGQRGRGKGQGQPLHGTGGHGHAVSRSPEQRGISPGADGSAVQSLQLCSAETLVVEVSQRFCPLEQAASLLCRVRMGRAFFSSEPVGEG